MCVYREAWKALGDMSKEEAMKAYVDEILLVSCFISVVYVYRIDLFRIILFRCSDFGDDSCDGGGVRAAGRARTLLRSGGK